MPTHNFFAVKAGKKLISTALAKSNLAAGAVQIKGLEANAALDLVIKSLLALKKTYESEAKAAMADHFISQGCTARERPKNFKGIEGDAVASCELRNRSVNSPLDDNEVRQLQLNKILIEENVVDDGGLYFNPEYEGDNALINRINQALNGIKGIPKDLFLRRPEHTEYVIGDDTLNTLFRKPAELVEKLLPIVAVLAIKPTYRGNFDDAFSLVKELLEDGTAPPKQKKSKAVVRRIEKI